MKIVNSIGSYFILGFLACSGCQVKGDKFASEVSSEGKQPMLSARAADTLKLYPFLRRQYRTDGDKELMEIRCQNDTLIIATTGWFFYYPFGKVNNEKTLKNAFHIYQFVDEIQHKGDNDSTKLYRFNKDASFVKFVKSDDNTRFEIVSAVINNPDMVFLNGVKVGMSKSEFYRTYFKRNIERELPDIKVVEIITALDGMWHYYTFSGGRLSQIKLSTDYLLDQK
jgi:hypothetical protein